MPQENHSKPAYPKRESFFAHRFIRLMAKTCLAARIGRDATWMLAVIAMTEDAIRFSGPVTYFNQDLANQFGSSVDALDRARKRAIEAGWLHYKPGAKHRAGLYWVLIPPEEQGKPDGPSCEDDFVPQIADESPNTSADSGGNCGTNSGRKCGTKCGTFRPKTTPNTEAALPPPFEEEEKTTNIDPGEVFTAWNLMAKEAGIPTAAKLTVNRRKSILTRGNDVFWLEHWRDALQRVSRSGFCRGLVASKTWKADIDWFLKTDTVVKLIEGKYDDAPTSPSRMAHTYPKTRPED